MNLISCAAGRLHSHNKETRKRHTQFLKVSSIWRWTTTLTFLYFTASVTKGAILTAVYMCYGSQDVEPHL